MSRFPAVTGKRLIAALGRLGFEEIRVRGSHHYPRHADGRSTVVPSHAGETIGRIQLLVSKNSRNIGR